eukprot:176446-Hanusia_phi.AAC.1
MSIPGRRALNSLAPVRFVHTLYETSTGNDTDVLVDSCSGKYPEPSYNLASCDPCVLSIIMRTGDLAPSFLSPSTSRGPLTMRFLHRTLLPLFSRPLQTSIFRLVLSFLSDSHTVALHCNLSASQHNGAQRVGTNEGA